VVARLGGDDFGVLMWNLDESRAKAKVVELEALIASVNVDHSSGALGVGASAGAVALDPDVSVAAIIDAADQAMYARKKGKRG
jgi:diguanylate cyclase (GGDEF)-like protein